MFMMFSRSLVLGSADSYALLVWKVSWSNSWSSDACHDSCSDDDASTASEMVVACGVSSESKLKAKLANKPTGACTCRSLARHGRMQLFLLTVRSLLLTAELFAYSCVWELFCLQLELSHLQLELFYFQLKLPCLQWESASNKHLNGLQEKMLKCE